MTCSRLDSVIKTMNLKSSPFFTILSKNWRTLLRYILSRKKMRHVLYNTPPLWKNILSLRFYKRSAGLDEKKFWILSRLKANRRDVSPSASLNKRDFWIIHLWKRWPKKCGSFHFARKSEKRPSKKYTALAKFHLFSSSR